MTTLRVSAPPCLVLPILGIRWARPTPTHPQLCCYSDLPCSSCLTFPITFYGSPEPSVKTMANPLKEALHDPGTLVLAFQPRVPSFPDIPQNSSHTPMLTVPV